MVASCKVISVVNWRQGSWHGYLVMHGEPTRLLVSQTYPRGGDLGWEILEVRGQEPHVSRGQEPYVGRPPNSP